MITMIGRRWSKLSDNNVRIKLSADTSQAQKEIKLIDQQIKELGKDASVQGGTKPKKDGEESTSSAKDVGLGNLDALINVNKQILKTLNNMYSTIINPSANKGVKLIGDKLDSLDKSIKDNTGGKSNDSTGATTGSASQVGNGTTGTSTPSPTNLPSGISDGSSAGDTLKQVAGKLVTATATLSALRGIGNWVVAGAEKSASLESKAYMSYNTTGMFGDNFSSARNYAHGVGNAYGYNSEATMDFQDAYMDRAGFTNKENLTTDTSNLMRVSKAYGIDLSGTGAAAGRFVQTGTLASGEQYKFANLLATSIKEAGMRGRESEQLDVLESINDVLSQTLVTVTHDGQNNATALYNLLAATEDSLKGARGGNAVSSINDAITGGSNKMDVLLGWGTSYTGAEGRWELEKLKAQGISNPDNLSKVFSNFERFTGQPIDSAHGKLALQELLGINPELVEVLVRNAEDIKTGNYSEDFISSLKEYEGDSDVSGLIDNYNKSKVSTQEQYQNTKENAHESAGDFLNTVTSGLKDWFVGLSTGDQAGLTAGGMVGSATAVGAGGQFLVKKGADFLGQFRKGSGATTGATTGAGVVDDVGKAASGVDDATKVVSGSLDDVGKAALNSADDVVKAAGTIGKAGKLVLGIGSALELVSTAIDVKDAIDRDDGREVAQEVGGGAGTVAGMVGGGILGGIASGAVTGALAGSVAPGIGNIIGGIAGAIIGVGTTLLGGSIGESAGGAIYDMTTEDKKLSEEQHNQIKEYYNKVAELYKKDGNDAAQDYTLQSVVPYLNSIGVSKSITDSYKNDVGKPDFMEDYENGRFKLGVDYVPYDEFKAILHQGEAVLTADEAKRWRNGSQSQSSDMRLSASDFTNKVVNKFYDAVKLESDSLEKREKLNHQFNEQNLETNNIRQDSSNIASNHIEDSKTSQNSGVWNRMLNLFGFNTSAAVGNDYIPHDNTPINAHKGEAVLTADEAKRWRERNSINTIDNYISAPQTHLKSQSLSPPYSGTSVLEIKLSGAVGGMTLENQHVIVQAVIQQLGLSKGSILGSLGNSFVRTPN